MNLFEDRVLSSFGVSIATGLMLESIFDPTTDRYDNSREIPNKVDIDKYRYHVYNLTTLARNIISSVGNKVNMQTLILASEFKETFIDELYTLMSLYENTSCELVFFLPDYSQVFKNINSNVNTKPSSKYLDYSIAYNVLSSITNDEIFKKVLLINKDYRLYSLERKDILLTSHIGVDILNYKHFNKLHLLESNTGVLKDKDKYYTKFHKMGKNDLSHIPFLEETVYFLGDNVVSNINSLFIRRQLYEISIASKWKFTTNTEKVRSDISKNTELKVLLEQLKKSYKG